MSVSVVVCGNDPPEEPHFVHVPEPGADDAVAVVDKVTVPVAGGFPVDTGETDDDAPVKEDATPLG